MWIKHSWLETVRTRTIKWWSPYVICHYIWHMGSVISWARECTFYIHLMHAVRVKSAGIFTALINWADFFKTAAATVMSAVPWEVSLAFLSRGICPSLIFLDFDAWSEGKNNKYQGKLKTREMVNMLSYICLPCNIQGWAEIFRQNFQHQHQIIVIENVLLNSKFFININIRYNSIWPSQAIAARFLFTVTVILSFI